MTASQWRPISHTVMRAAISTGGTHSRVCRFVTFRPQDTRYAVYLAQGGQRGRRMAVGYGTPDDALRAGCADMYEIDKPHLWRQKRVTK